MLLLVLLPNDKFSHLASLVSVPVKVYGLIYDLKFMGGRGGSSKVKSVNVKVLNQRTS